MELARQIQAFLAMDRLLDGPSRHRDGLFARLPG